MSSQPNLLEQVGRGLKSFVAPGTLSDQQQRARGSELIRNMVTGGLALGGGTSLAVALANRIKALREEEELEDESILDDETLYIPAPVTKEASAKEGVSPWLAPGLAATGGLLAAGGSYALVQSLWNKIEKRRRQKLLDEAQREAIAATDIEATKSASAVPPAQMNLADILTAGPVAIPLLTALAAGGITYSALDKSFPTVKKTQPTGPKRVRLVAPDGKMTALRAEADEEEPEEEAAEKSASLRRARDLEDAGYELMASMTANLGGEITRDLIHRAAKGGVPEMEATIKSAGALTLFDMVKGASYDPAPPAAVQLGVMALFKSAALAPTVRVIAAAEFQEHVPAISALARGNTPRALEKLASLGQVMGLMSRSASLPEFAEMTKEAAALEQAPAGVMDQDLLAGLQDRILQMVRAGSDVLPTVPRSSATHEELEQRDAALTTDAAGGQGGESEEETDATQGEDQESQGNDDVIDSMMASPRPGDILEPTT
jgi:hypothetical protein